MNSPKPEFPVHSSSRAAIFDLVLHHLILPFKPLGVTFFLMARPVPTTPGAARTHEHFAYYAPICCASRAIWIPKLMTTFSDSTIYRLTIRTDGVDAFAVDAAFIGIALSLLVFAHAIITVTTTGTLTVIVYAHTVHTTQTFLHAGPAMSVFTTSFMTIALIAVPIVL